MFHYYVYYRIDAARRDGAHAAVAQLQYELAATTGVTGRLLRRCDDELLWMEIYENVTARDRFEDALHSALARCSFQHFLAAGEKRHTECFQGLEEVLG